MTANELDQWMQHHCTGHQERMSMNGVDWLLLTMTDGWIAVLERTEDSYIPRIQAKDRAHAVGFCNRVERPRVPISPIF